MPADASASQSRGNLMHIRNRKRKDLLPSQIPQSAGRWKPAGTGRASFACIYLRLRGAGATHKREHSHAI
jgi:hypothetical protein